EFASASADRTARVRKKRERGLNVFTMCSLNHHRKHAGQAHAYREPALRYRILTAQQPGVVGAVIHGLPSRSTFGIGNNNPDVLKADSKFGLFAHLVSF